MHDWGAHLVDHALQLDLGPCRRLTAWLLESPWEGVDSGGHGRITMEFDEVIFQVDTSRICRFDRPRWWIVGTEGGFLARRRGGVFEKVSLGPSLRGMRINSLAEDRNVVLWIGTAGAGVARWCQGACDLFSVGDKNDVTNNTVTKVITDRKGRPWAIAGERLATFEGGAWKIASGAPSSARNIRPFRSA